MSQITDPIPQEIQLELNNLNLDLDAKIPAKKLDKNLLIATWNIRAFGDLTKKWESQEDDSPKRDYHSLMCIVEIIKRFDVIAVQEVKGNIRALRYALKLLGNNYSLILTDVNKGKVGNDERMAYIFDTRRVQMSGLACELVVPEEWQKSVGEEVMKEQFCRSPYAVSFKSNEQTFILVTLHILYGKKSADRINELKGIANWMADWAKDLNAYHQNLITLGDFNIDKRGDLLNQTFIESGLFVPPSLQSKEVTRSIFDETKYYDQIAWFQNKKGVNNLSLEYNTGGNYDFMQTCLINRSLTKVQKSWMLSDHYPLWVEFNL
ncbi:MAG: endonuclease/exonuclease/phosphatase family protein [Crocinitomicaceae bacterium]|nr:endonuclease/exonuclease/phosphatase family protein [Crocinitomicaceae bacterium]